MTFHARSDRVEMESEGVMDRTFWLPRRPMSMPFSSTSTAAAPALDTKSTTKRAPTSRAISPSSLMQGVSVPEGVSQCTAVMTFGRKRSAASRTFPKSGVWS